MITLNSTSAQAVQVVQLSKRAQSAQTLPSSPNSAEYQMINSKIRLNLAFIYKIMSNYKIKVNNIKYVNK